LRLGLKLVAVNGSQAVTVPEGRTLVVGRSPACDVPIRDLTVSRHHGEIEASAAGLRIRDLGSTNGTFVNGARISESVAAAGSRVAFGKVLFQVMEERAPGAPPDAADETDHLVIVRQLRAQSLTDIASLLAQEPTGPAADAAAARPLRVRGEAPAERRAAALALLLEIAKELSQQGEPARLLDKAARLLLQALRIDRVDILTRGDHDRSDEMVPRVSKARPGCAPGSGRVPRLAARKAGRERVAVLISEAPAGAGAGPRSGDANAPAATSASAAPAGAAQDDAPGTAPSPPVAVPEPGNAPDDVGRVETGDRGTGRSESGAVSGTGTVSGTGAISGTGAVPGTGEVAVQPAPIQAAAPAQPVSAERRGNAICAPLLGMQATVLGLLYVVTAEDALGREDLEFLTAFAGIVAVTMENLWLMERARGEAVSQAAYQRHFAPFVAEQIAGQSGGHEGVVGLEGARRRVAFLCCDLRGFTELAEELPPAETARLLSEFFGEMVNVIFEHGGTLDRLTGAGLTALWGAPLGRQDDADEAVQAAVGIQRELDRLNGEWSRQGRQNLAAAIGIDLGQVFAGNVGSERRLDFTAIGKPVERAAGLAAAAAAGEILLSEALLEALDSPPPTDATPAAGDRAYRVDWRTPPTLRQSGELPQQP